MFLDWHNKHAFGLLQPTALGPIEESATGPSVWRGRRDLYRMMWLEVDTCAVCFGPMQFVPSNVKGSLTNVFRCLNRVLPIHYALWNECGPGGRTSGFLVDPSDVERMQLGL